MALQLPLVDTGIWIEVKDGHPDALALFRRHYSHKPYKDGRNPVLFVGPGEKMVLLTKDLKALFVWRKFQSSDGQMGINCAVFRNEGAGLSSDLIREAMTVAWRRWPGERLYTYVNARKIKSRNPGACFQYVGWTRCGLTKWNKLLILVKWCQPHWDQLREAIKAKGLDVLVSKDGLGAAKQVAEELKGESVDACGFDPLLRAWSMINGRALEVGLGLVGCPLCYLRSHAETCKEPNCAAPRPEDWINGCTDSLRQYAEDLCLIPKGKPSGPSPETGPSPPPPLHD